MASDDMCTIVCSVQFDFVKQQPVLGNPPLRLVICQMRFPHQVGIAEADVRPIQKALAEDYPRPEIGKVAGLTLGPGGVAAGDSEPVFHFRSEGQDWTATITADSVSLETAAYIDFMDFVQRWHGVVDPVVRELGLSRQERIGLRYVNELDCPPAPEPADLERILRPELVGVVGAHARTQKLQTSMQEMRFVQERGVCTLRHGLVRRNSQDGVYVLDFDFYDDTAQTIALEDQVKLLADFNHEAYELFRWAIPDDQFATFNPQEVGTSA